MADRIKFAVRCTPIETITDENAAEHDILASEVNKSLGGGGDSVTVANYAGSAANQGQLTAATNYSTATHAAGGTQLTATTTADFVFIKNTGFKFSSATVLGASTTDCIMVAIRTEGYSTGAQDGWYTQAEASQVQFFEIAWLKPGQAIVLPLGASSLSVTQFGGNANDLATLTTGGEYGQAAIYVMTFESDGTTAASGNAVEYLVVT